MAHDTHDRCRSAIGPVCPISAARRLAAALAWLSAIPSVAGCLLQQFVPASIDGMFPVPQLVAVGPWWGLGGLLAVLFACAGRHWLPGILGAACIMFQIAWTVGFWLPSDAAEAARAQVASTSRSAAADFSTASSDAVDTAASTLRVMTLNAYFGQADPDDVIELVRSESVQVLCLQEVTPSLTEALRGAGLPDLLPYETGAATGDQIWSALPLADETSDAVGYSGCAMPAASVEVGGARLRFVSVHTCAPMPGLERWWHESLHKIAALRGYDELYRDGDRYVLMGDFNASVSHASFRAILEAGFTDAAMEAGEGMHFTWPADRAAPPFLTLDHVVLDEGLVAFDLAYHTVPGSDHRALVATVALGE